MSKLRSFLVAAALAGFSAGSTAANLYEPGSIPFQMFKVVEPVVGREVTPVFLIGNAPSELMASLDHEAVKKAGIPKATFDYFLANLHPDSLEHGVVGYAMSGFAVPGNESANRTCAIVMATREQFQTTTTMFHESVHCKNFAELRVDNGAWRLAASMNRPALGMSNNQFMSLFHEVLAAYIQVAYNSNLGIKDGLGMVIRAAQPDKNTATSIGYRTARSALKMCEAKGACSTYAPDVVRMLNSNSYARAQMMLDLKELFDAARDSGYVVENK